MLFEQGKGWGFEVGTVGLEFPNGLLGIDSNARCCFPGYKIIFMTRIPSSPSPSHSPVKVTFFFSFIEDSMNL